MDDRPYAPVAVPTPRTSLWCASREVLALRVRRLESLESWAPLIVLLGVIASMISWWLRAD